MNNFVILFAFVILLAYLAVVFGEKELRDSSAIAPSDFENNSSELIAGRLKKLRHPALYGLSSVWGLHALVGFIWIKVKLAILSFIFGSAIFLGLRYFLPKDHCPIEIIKEGSTIHYKHGPAFSGHDYIPYTLDHDSPSIADLPKNEPYSSYSDAYSYSPPSTAPDTHRVGRRSAERQFETEEQISEFMFSFLGLNSKACRRRFICEMEFRSNENPLTRLAFRIVGRGIFGKYTNKRNQNGHATSFSECAAVNSDCTVIEEDTPEEEDAVQTEHPEEYQSGEQKNEDNEISVVERRSLPTEEDDTVVDVLEQENAGNLQAEKQGFKLRRRRNQQEQGNPIASVIFTRSENSRHL